jgi:DNA-binding NarL/FixJ family response regulator
MNHKNHKPYKNSRLEEVKKLLDKGFTARAIAWKLNMSTQNVYAYIKKWITK